MTEDFNYPKVTPLSSVRKERVKTQPIKIKELLNFYEKSKSASKAPVRTRCQPERLTMLYPDIRSEPCLQTKKVLQKNEEEEQCAKSGISERKVRRNLNIAFATSKQHTENIENEPPKVPKKINAYESITSSNPNRKTMTSAVVSTNNTMTQHRSSLLPPNTIKKLYVMKSKNSKEENFKDCPELSVEQESNTTNHKEALDDVPQNDSARKTITNDDLSNTPSSENQINNKCLQNENNNTNNKIDRNIDAKNVSNRTPITSKPGIARKSHVNNISLSPPKNIREDDSTDLSMKNHENNLAVTETVTNIQQSIDDLHNATISEGIARLNLNLSDEEYESSNKEKDVLKYLGNNIKQLICEAEGNIVKLKLVLDYIEKLTLPLMIPTENKSINHEIQTVSLNKIDKGIQVDISHEAHSNTDAKLVDVNLEEIVNDVPQSDVDLITFSFNETDKENCDNISENSITQSNCTTEDSFLRLENECNIQHRKPISNEKESPLVFTTPISKKDLTNKTINKSKRCLREYCLLKSRMSFLETPDGKQFRSSNNNKTVAGVKTSLSTRLLTEIQNLYTESPEDTN